MTDIGVTEKVVVCYNTLIKSPFLGQNGRMPSLSFGSTWYCAGCLLSRSDSPVLHSLLVQHGSLPEATHCGVLDILH
jgi:hypothetical protein